MRISHHFCLMALEKAFLICVLSDLARFSELNAKMGLLRA
jgi:hypothetical protein